MFRFPPCAVGWLVDKGWPAALIVLGEQNAIVFNFQIRGSCSAASGWRRRNCPERRTFRSGKMIFLTFADVSLFQPRSCAPFRLRTRRKGKLKCSLYHRCRCTFDLRANAYYFHEASIFATSTATRHYQWYRISSDDHRVCSSACFLKILQLASCSAQKPLKGESRPSGLLRGISEGLHDIRAWQQLVQAGPVKGYPPTKSSNVVVVELNET